MLGGGGIGEHEASAVVGGDGIREHEASAVFGGGGIGEHEASAVTGAGGIGEHEASAVTGGGGIAEQSIAVLGGGGIFDPEPAGRRALAGTASPVLDFISPIVRLIARPVTAPVAKKSPPSRGSRAEKIRRATLRTSVSGGFARRPGSVALVARESIASTGGSMSI